MRTDGRLAATTRAVLAATWMLASLLVVACAVNGPISTPVTSDSSAAPPSRPLAEPPSASLAVEGGDPVAGQLGTYLWLDGGSDAPWLAGAPILAGSGEPLELSLDPPVPIVTWRARAVPAPASGPDGATSLGSGAGEVRFEAPGVGRWSVEVAIEFADGLGSASYFWQVEVR